MKKFGFVVFTMIAGLAAIGCGSSVCDDAKTAVTDCCAKIGDATQKAACEASVKDSDWSSLTDDQCKAIQDTYSAACK